MNQILLTDEVLNELKVFMLQMKSRLQGDIIRYGDDDSPDVVEWVKGCNKQLTFAKFIYDAAQAATPVPDGEREGWVKGWGEVLHKCSVCGESWETIEEAESCIHYASSGKKGGVLYCKGEGCRAAVFAEDFSGSEYLCPVHQTATGWEPKVSTIQDLVSAVDLIEELVHAVNNLLSDEPPLHRTSEYEVLSNAAQHFVDLLRPSKTGGAK